MGRGSALHLFRHCPGKPANQISASFDMCESIETVEACEKSKVVKIVNSVRNSDSDVGNSPVLWLFLANCLLAC